MPLPRASARIYTTLAPLPFALFSRLRYAYSSHSIAAGERRPEARHTSLTLTRSRADFLHVSCPTDHFRGRSPTPGPSWVEVPGPPLERAG